MTLQEAKDQITEYHYGAMFKWDALQDHIKVTLFEQVIDLYARSKHNEGAKDQLTLANEHCMKMHNHVLLEVPKPEFKP